MKRKKKWSCTLSTSASIPENTAVYPVFLPVPEAARHLSARKKVIYLSQFARRAVDLSAEKSYIPRIDLMKGPDGAPIPSNGIYWSLTHKSEFVGGVVARYPIGLDVEKVKPCSQALKEKVAGKDEWALSSTATDRLFFRFWTAKEAVLKAAGVGLTALSRCRVAEIIDEMHLMVRYGDKLWSVEHLYFHGHTAAIVVNRQPIRWSVESLETARRRTETYPSM